MNVGYICLQLPSLSIATGLIRNISRGKEVIPKADIFNGAFQISGREFSAGNYLTLIGVKHT